MEKGYKEHWTFEDLVDYHTPELLEDITAPLLVLHACLRRTGSHPEYAAALDSFMTATTKFCEQQLAQAKH